MNYGELLNLYFERSAALQSYWTLYVVIVGGLLAFSSLRRVPDLLTTGLVSILFACFAYKNMGAIEEASLQRHAVLASLTQAATPESAPSTFPQARSQIEATLHPPEVDGVKQFHLISDILTLLTLWAMELRRRRQQTE